MDVRDRGADSFGSIMSYMHNYKGVKSAYTKQQYASE